MASSITQETYDGLPSLYANVGKWIDASIDVFNLYSFSSGNSNRIFVVNTALTLESGTWGELGFVVGQTMDIEFNDLSLPPPQNPVQTVKVITYINGNVLYIDSAFGSYPSATFPTSGSLGGMTLQIDESPESLEFFFNLTKDGQQSVNSVIDQQINKFIGDTGTLAESASIPMVQQNLYSGGWMKDVELTRNLDFGIRRQYTITFKLFQWGVVQDGNEIPSYYDAQSTLTPYIRTRMVSINGNPNSVQTATNGANLGSCGYFDENFNGGVVNYTKDSIDLLDLNGDSIGQIDYSNFTDFTAIISAPNQDTVSSVYRIGLVWKPIDTTFYQGQQLNLGQNLLVNAQDFDFNHSLSPDGTIYAGESNADGVHFDFQNLQFEQIGGDKLRVTGRIIPSSEAVAFFDAIPDGGRNMVIWVQVGDYTLTGQNSDEVAVEIYNADNFDAPTLGVQIPDIVDETLLDHGGNDITSAVTPNTTTEDDVLFVSNFRLIDGINYQGIRTSIVAFNDVTEEQFTLEDEFFSFAQVVNIANQFQPNIELSRGFNLPPDSDRNVISIKRNPAIDIAGKYGIQLNYGYLSRWEYWLEQANANDDFFDILQSFDGKNKDWQHYNTGNWFLRLSFFTRVNDVDDFNHQEIQIRPYEDDVNLSIVRTLTNLSDLTNPTALVSNELMQIDIEFTWIIGLFTNPWVEFTIEDKEGGNRWVISSVLDQGNVSGNPFKPKTGQTKIELTGIGSNILTASCNIDTSLINVNLSSLSYRVYSEDKTAKTTTLGTVKTLTTGLGKTPAP